MTESLALNVTGGRLVRILYGRKVEGESLQGSSAEELKAGGRSYRFDIAGTYWQYHTKLNI